MLGKKTRKYKYKKKLKNQMRLNRGHRILTQDDLDKALKIGYGVLAHLRAKEKKRR
jgi:hypothetical protein